MVRMDTDIAVVAAGPAGLAAAVAAAERGAKVVILEKASTVGGAGNMAGGPFAVESRLQRERKMGFSREEAFRLHMDYVHWRADARLVKAFIDKSADTIDWLEAMGVEFEEVRCHNPGFGFTWHIVKGVGKDQGQFGNSGNVMKLMADRAKMLGAKIRLRTPVTRIAKEGGRIAGVAAEDETGESVEVTSKAVIVATGGFGDNPTWIRKYGGFELEKDFVSIRVPGLAGDGIRMAWEVGAAPTPMIMQLVPISIPDLGFLSLANFTFSQPNLLVNLQGERFVNEELVDNPTFFGNALAIQKKRSAFMILDERTKQEYDVKGLDYPADVLVADTSGEGFDAQVMRAIEQGGKNLLVADSIDEIADGFGIDREVLQRTVEEYNRACDTGRDMLFHKNPRYLRPVRQAKFYVACFFPNGLGSLGGIKINHKTEVLDKEFDPIPGLYAAGTDASAIYGDSYAYLLPGNTLGFALNTGRIAGEQAAEYVMTSGL